RVLRGLVDCRELLVLLPTLHQSYHCLFLGQPGRCRWFSVCPSARCNLSPRSRKILRSSCDRPSNDIIDVFTAPIGNNAKYFPTRARPPARAFDSGPATGPTPYAYDQ